MAAATSSLLPRVRYARVRARRSRERTHRLAFAVPPPVVQILPSRDRSGGRCSSGSLATTPLSPSSVGHQVRLPMTQEGEGSLATELGLMCSRELPRRATRETFSSSSIPGRGELVPLRAPWQFVSPSLPLKSLRFTATCHGYMRTSPRPANGGLHNEREASVATDVRGGRSRAIGPMGLDRLSTETKHAFKTTEFWAMLAIVAGILLASLIVGDDGGSSVGDGGGGDAFPAIRAWLYVAVVASAYIVSRGLAKAGSYEPYWANRDDRPGRDDDH